MPRSLFFCPVIKRLFEFFKATGEAHWAGSRVCRIPRPAPAFAVKRGARLERCRAIVGQLCHLRLYTEAPGPSPRKSRPKRAAFLM